VLKKVEKENGGTLIMPRPDDGDDGVDTRISISVMELCELTSIKKEDIMSTLTLYSMSDYHRGEWVMTLTSDMVEAYRRAQMKRQTRIDPSKIRFTPREWSRRRQH
jgi:histone acetyltransferase HTATIP